VTEFLNSSIRMIWFIIVNGSFPPSLDSFAEDASALERGRVFLAEDPRS
jgi:hypothetical protein